MMEWQSDPRGPWVCGLWLNHTCPKKFENGRPLSLAKAQVRRETDARDENTATTPMKIRKVIRTVVAAVLPVELYRIWMIG